jgi:hypothetical protein
MGIENAETYICRMLKGWILFIFCWFVFQASADAQTCTLTVAGNVNWSTGSWSCTSGSPPTTAGTWTGNVVVTGLGNGESLTVDINIRVTGNVTLNVSGAAPALIIPSGITFQVDGNLGSGSVNNLNLTTNGTLNVGGTMQLKNNGVIQGSGRINATSIDVKNGTSCGTGCPTVYTGTCSSGNSWCSGSTVNTTGGALPVGLVRFVVETFEDRVSLEWETSSEINNDFFIVERLQGNNEWVSIGQVDGNGTSNDSHAYKFEDYDVNPSEVAYYRLKQVDYNGDQTVFNVVKTEKLDLKGHKYSIIKSESTIEILFDDDQLDYTEVILIDAMGNVLSRETLEYALKGQRLEFNLEEYPTGWYVVGISGTDNFHFEKMIFH